MIRAETTTRRHEHAVHFYRGDDDLAEMVASYLAAAVGADRTVVAITTPSHRLSIERRLAALAIDVQCARDDRRLIFQDADATLARLIVDGQVSREAFDREVGTLIRTAGESSDGVRAYGEMVDLLWQAGDIPAAIELEMLWNDLIAELQFPLLCAYHSAAVAAPEHEHALREVCRLHTSVSSAPSADLAPARGLGGNGEVSREFQPEPDAPRAARRFVEEVLEPRGYSRATVEDARLVVSELVTNAVIHARSPLSVSISAGQGVVRLAVADRGAMLARVDAQSFAAADRGRGLQLVASLAQDWGVVPTVSGKSVWADVLAR